MCFLTFWTYAVRKLLMSEEGTAIYSMGLCVGFSKKEGGEEKAVIATNGSFYGLF